MCGRKVDISHTTTTTTTTNNNNNNNNNNNQAQDSKNGSYGMLFPHWCYSGV